MKSLAYFTIVKYRIGGCALLLLLCGCNPYPSRLEPYREWTEYCREMAIRKKDPEEGLKCVETVEHRVDDAFLGRGRKQ